MVTRRTGLDPLSYMGVEPTTPAQFVTGLSRNPTTQDYNNFTIGTVWVVRGTNAIWMLVEKTDFIATWLQLGTGGSGLNTLTGNSGGAIFPTGGNINVLGSGAITVTGNSGTSTLTIASDGTLAVTYEGNTGTATAAGGILNIDGTNNITTTASGNTISVAVTGTTNHGVQVGNASGSLTSLTVGSNGQVLIAATAANPAFATLTSIGGSIAFTPGPNTLNLEAVSGTPLTIDCDSGSASPMAGTLNVVGGDNITTTGSGNTVTAAVSGTTNHAMQIGNASGSLTSIAVGVNGQVVIAASGGDPAFATLSSSGGTIVFTPGANALNMEAVLSSGSLTIDTDSGSASPIAGILNVVGGDSISTSGSGDTVTASVSGATQYAPQMGSATGALADVGVMTTGQLMIGVSALAPNLARLTAGANIAIDDTTIPGEITISSTGGSTGIAAINKYTSNDTWTKNPSTSTVYIIVWNGGNGGGSGRQGSSTAAGGGAGGSAGGVLVLSQPAYLFGASESVTVGAAGPGGAAQAVANTNGNAGGAGGSSSVGNVEIAYTATSAGGTNGNATATANPMIFFNSLQVNPNFSPGGTGTLTNGLIPTFTGSSLPLYDQQSTGGGGGGGADSVTARSGGDGMSVWLYGYNIAFMSYSPLTAGGTGGIETGTINGSAGANFISTTGGRIVPATGGGGGGGQKSGMVAGNGGNGGIPAGGGGGGGGSLNTTNSGTGGNGGRGEVWIVEYY